MKDRFLFMIDLRMFDDPVMNKTTSTGSGNNLAPEMKEYYDRTLLENAKPKLVHDQFAQKRPIPRNNGKVISFRKFDKLAPATTPLTEGVTPAGSKLNVTEVTAEVKQYGAYYMLTDFLEMTAIDPIVQEACKNLGDNAGETLDTITREELMTGTNVIYGDGSVEARTAITSAMTLTLKTVRMAKRILDRMDATKLEGDTYAIIIHPDTAFDIGNELEELYKHTESGVKRLFQGEIGTYFGVRFIEASRAKIFASAGAALGSGSEKVDVYASLVLGKDAYGITSIDGGGIESIIKQKGSAGTADPLNQRSTCGWKANRAVKILLPHNMVRIEHATSTNEHVAN